MPYIGNVTTSSNVNGSQINNGTITGDKLSLPFDYDSATLYLDNTNNRVGILTASPSSTLTVGTGGVVSIPLASAATPSLIFGTDTNTGIYSPGADQLAISTNGSGRVFVDANGNVGVGAAPTNYAGYNNFVQNGSAGTTFEQRISGTLVGNLVVDSAVALKAVTAIPIALSTNNTERLRITSAGLVGIGTTGPLATLDITGSGEPLRFQSTTASTNYITHKHNSSGDIAYLGAGGGAALGSGATTDYAIRANQGALLFATNGNNERARIDSSGRLLVGTSSALTGTGGLVDQFQIGNGAISVGAYSANQFGNRIQFTKSRNATTGSQTVVQSGDTLGYLEWAGSDGTNFDLAARITAEVDGTPGTDDMPGRLVFSTTADGASSPTERMRISSNGFIGIGNTAPSNTLSLGDVGGIGQDTNSLYVGGNFTGTGDNFKKTGNYANQIHFDTSAGHITFKSTSSTGTAGNSISFIDQFRISSTGAQSSVIPGGSTLYPSFDCRAWVNFNGTGTVAIRGSGNVSSITDVAVGQYTVNFATAMPDANYAPTGMAGYKDATNNNEISWISLRRSSSSAFSTTACDITTGFTVSNAGADVNYVCVAFFR